MSVKSSSIGSEHNSGGGRSLSSLLGRGASAAEDRTKARRAISSEDLLHEVLEAATSVEVLGRIRKLMHEQTLDAFLLSTGDAHQSEYVSDHDTLLAYASGFTGSNGTIVITQKEALLWTDGRYFLQAAKEMSAEWTLMRMGNAGVPEVGDWLASKSVLHTVGVDPTLISAASAKRLQNAFGSRKVLQGVTVNPVAEVWGARRPVAPKSPVCIHAQKYAGRTAQEKVADMKTALKNNDAVAVVISMLDEVAWLLNIRGGDIAFNPVVTAYVIVTLRDAHLFIDETKLSPELKKHLDHVVIHPYGSIAAFIKSEFHNASAPVWVDSTQLNWQLFLSLPSTLEKPSPVTLPKSLKNPSELQGVREAHLRDGVALTAFLAWLDSTVKGGSQVTEYDVTVKIEEFRARMQMHRGPSFATIAGYGANGAIIHYKPSATESAVIGTESLFLLDSGGQYLDGTTDVTRTLHFGTPTEHQRRCFTLVLRGHLALAMLVFPEGMLGSRFDSVCRVPLWSAGLDYNHGTGHGVGAYLNVHEGPQRIGFRRMDGLEVGFYNGMTISNEPGYYEEGNFGVRIETVCITVPHVFSTPTPTPDKKFCKLETVTLAPLQRNLIDVSLLSAPEIDWLNAYHARVRESLEPLLASYFPEALGYMMEHTAPL